MNETLSNNIKKKLREQGKDFNALSEMLGITRQSLYRRLTNNPTLSTLIEIADALGCRVVDLLIDPCEKVVQADCENNEPVITNLIECPNCGAKMFVAPMKDIL